MQSSKADEQSFRKFSEHGKFVGCAVISLLLALVFSILSYNSLEQLRKASDIHYKTYLLAQQLRLSSDQLTLMARTYAVTGNIRYLEFFQAIVDIRNGHKSRPHNYHRVYWDILMPKDGEAPFSNGEKNSLTDLFIQEGVLESELKLLSAAKASSDTLIELEKEAFKLIGISVSNPPINSLINDLNRINAIEILFSENYLSSKREIMTSLNKFFEEKERRTQNDVTSTRQKNKTYTVIASVLYSMSLIILILTMYYKYKYFKTSLAYLNEEVNDRTQSLKTKTVELEKSVIEERRIQELLIESEKMSSLGEMIPSISHELNTPIGLGITSSSYQLELLEGLEKKISLNKITKNNLKDSLHSLKECANIIHDNLIHGAELISNVKQISVDQAIDDTRIINIKDYVDKILNTLKPQYKKRAINVINNTPNDITLMVNTGGLSQVISNLIMNAILHAFNIDASGSITIDAHIEQGHILIVIADDGKGIAAEYLDKIYMPFFTTKKGQGGTGLGLHIVKDIVEKKLFGTLTCRSLLSKGTAFTINIPKNINAQ